MDTLQPKDLIAMTVILALVVFKLTGHNGTFDVPAGLIVGYYFGKRQVGLDAGK